MSKRTALALLGLALIAAAAVVLTYGSGLAPFQDSWEFLMNRRAPSAATLLDPHNEHIVLIPVAIDELLLRLFGMGSTLPEFAVLAVLLLGTATVTYVYVSRRLGAWPALIAALLLLFLGPAWQDLLWPFQIGFVGAALCGVAMLLALERGDRGGDLAACALLALAIGFSSLGLSFAAAAALVVLQRRRRLGLRRLYVVAVPLALYAAWYLGWGHDAETHVSLHNVLVSPRYLAEGFAAAVGSLLALATVFDEAVGRSTWGYVALGLLAVLAAYRLFRRPLGRGDGLWPVTAAAVSFWLLAGFNTVPGREAWSSRYVYVGALFVVLMAANLLRGARFDRRVLAVATALGLAVAVVNLVPLREGRDFFESQTVLTRADLGAIEIAARTVRPDFALPPEIAGTSFLNEIEAGEYLTAVDEFGSPAYTPAELAAAPAAGRRQADVVLAHALPLAIGAAPDEARGRCVAVAGEGPEPPLALRPGVTTVAIAPGEAGAIRLRRFATADYPLSSEGLAGGSTTRLSIPADGSARPWRLRVDAPQGATVCRGG